MKNPKSEIRNPKQIQMTQIPMFKTFRICNFKHLVLSRISCFGIRIYKSSVGFTLVELLLYAGLFMLLLVVLLQLFTSIINVQLESTAVSSVTQDGQYILARLTYDITQADRIVTPSSFNVSSSTMTLASASGSLTYTLSNGSLLMNGDRLNSYDTTVSNFSITRLVSTYGINSLTVGFTLTSVTKPQTGNRSENFQTTVSLRK